MKIKKPKEFSWDDSLQVAVEKRAFGHAKAGALIARIASSETFNPLAILFHLSQLGFYGEDIWYGFESYCHSDVDWFKDCIQSEDKQFYNFVMDWKAKKALAVMKGET